MELFFLPYFDPTDAHLLLPAEESRHIAKVLRKRPGETIELTDGKGHRIQAIIGSRQQQLKLTVQKVESLPFPPENRMEIGLAMIRPNRMDWAVEKVCELGVERIVPLHCQYTAYPRVKPDHLQKIAISAIKQSRQFYLPEILPPLSFADWINSLQQLPAGRWIAHPAGGNEPAVEYPSPAPQPLVLAVGPEGGFSPSELESARRAGFRLLKLGSTTLRSETAAVVGIARLKAAMGNLP